MPEADFPSRTLTVACVVITYTAKITKAKADATRTKPSFGSATRLTTTRPRTRNSASQRLCFGSRYTESKSQQYPLLPHSRSNFEFYTPRVYDHNYALYPNIQSLNRSEPYLSDQEIDLVYSEIKAYFRGWSIRISHANRRKVQE